MSGNTQMLSISGENRHSEENMPQQTYDQSWDCGSDIECFEKDGVIKQLKQELYEVNRENYYLKQQINDMEDVIEDNNMAIECQNGQLAKFNNSFKVLEEENASKIRELTQELAEVMFDRQHLNSMETQINTLTESNKNQDLNIKLLDTINNNLIETINQKNAEMEDLTDTTKDIESKANKYRNKYKVSKYEIQRINEELEDMNTENQKQKKEIQKLKISCKYHENDKNHHKQKVVAVSHTAVKQQELYDNTIRKVVSDNIEVNEEMAEKIFDFIMDCQKTFKRKMTENFAKTNADIIEERDNIHKKQRKMEEKRADGRKTCGSCDNTYANMKGLRTHLTVRHNMNTIDISKNEPQIIQDY